MATRRTKLLQGLARSLHVFGSAVLWFFILSIAGASLIVAGIHCLLGAGWALIAGGASLTAAAWFLRRGMTNG